MPVSGEKRPRALFVGGTRYDLPLPVELSRKWDAVDRLVETRVIARGGEVAAADPRFRLLGRGFYGALPFVTAGELRRFRPDVLVAQSPYEAFACLPVLRRAHAKLIVEVHGDWRTAGRLYGSPFRRLYARLSDRAAVFALRRADATRALSPFTSRLAEEATGRKPVASFVTFFDLASFTATSTAPLPQRPGVLWIGGLERVKNPALISDAWRIVAQEVPDARLTILGRGRLRPVVDALARELPDRVQIISRTDPPQVARLLDESTVLAMSSESEGFGRVIVEAFARHRAVVATAVGGVADVVEHDRNGLLVEPGAPDQLARALARVLTDRRLAERLAAGAGESLQRLTPSAEAYAATVREMVDRVIAAPHG